jgi:hypothetical protein
MRSRRTILTRSMNGPCSFKRSAANIETLNNAALSRAPEKIKLRPRRVVLTKRTASTSSGGGGVSLNLKALGLNELSLKDALENT